MSGTAFLTRCNKDTPNQRALDLIRLAADGHGQKEIAAQLGITHGTVKVYWAALTKNYNTNCTGVVAMALRRGWIT
jgi:DNA-binding CsgD family transcriptional regulator